MGLVLILGAVLCLHVVGGALEPPPVFWGDEVHYLRLARLDAQEGRRGLVPGTLRFDHRPELGSRVLSLFDDGQRTPLEIYRGAARLHLVLLLSLVGLTWLTGRCADLGPPTALGAAALVGFFPWLGFHVHSLWPELLHAVLLGAFLLATSYYLRDRRRLWLLVAGIAGGYAAMTKGVVLPFLPLTAVYLAFVDLRSARRRSPWLRVSGAALLVGSLLLVVSPQIARNAREGHGLRLSANRWWNLELGLTIPLEAMRREGLDRWAPNHEINRAYRRAASSPVEREALARERTLAYVRERGLARAVFDQGPKLVHLLVVEESSLEQSSGVRERWGEETPGWLGAIAGAGRLMWYALLLFGLLGAAVEARRGPVWGFLALFLAFQFTALAAVPVKARLMMPMTPVLALFAAALGARVLGRAMGQLDRGRSKSSSTEER